jgi:hypothetical protein
MGTPVGRGTLEGNRYRLLAGAQEDSPRASPSRQVMSESRQAGGQGGKRTLDEEEGKELEDGVVVLVEEEVGVEEDERRSVGSGSLTSSKAGGGFEFLDCLEKEDKEDVLEKKLEESRKRKRQSDGLVKQKGLLNMSGWLKRESEVRGEKRWKRSVVRGVVRGNGGAELVRDEEGLPLPKHFRLGLEKRRVELNYASRARNNFGTNKGGLTGGVGGK